MSIKKSDEKTSEKTMEKEPETVEPKKESPPSEPIKIMGEPKAEPRSENQPDIGKIVSDVFDQKLAQFIQKGPTNAPTPEPPKPGYKLFDEFDLGV